MFVTTLQAKATISATPDRPGIVSATIYRWDPASATWQVYQNLTMGQAGMVTRQSFDETVANSTRTAVNGYKTDNVVVIVSEVEVPQPPAPVEVKK